MDDWSGNRIRLPHAVNLGLAYGRIEAGSSGVVSADHNGMLSVLLDGDVPRTIRIPTALVDLVFEDDDSDAWVND